MTPQDIVARSYDAWRWRALRSVGTSSTAIDAAKLPVEAITPEQAVDEARASRNKSTTVTRSELAARYDGLHLPRAKRSKRGSRRASPTTSSPLARQQ